MNYKRQGLRALGLSILAALGLMAFMAAGAQAETKAEWLILTAGGLKTVNEIAGKSEAITGEQEGTENLFLILGLNVRLQCASVHVASATIVPTGHGKATLQFLGCELTDGTGKPNTTCIVHNISTSVLALLIKHSSGGTQRYVLFSPLTGLTFATPVFLDKAPDECSVTAAPITGHVVASISTASGAHAVEPLISTEGTLGLFSDVLKFGAQEGHLKAKALVRLNGANVTRAWGYHAL